MIILQFQLHNHVGQLSNIAVNRLLFAQVFCQSLLHETELPQRLGKPMIVEILAKNKIHKIIFGKALQGSATILTSGLQNIEPVIILLK